MKGVKVDKVRFSDKMVVSVRHIRKGVGYSIMNLVSSVKSIGMLSDGDMENWSYTRKDMNERRHKKEIHMKVARVAMKL